MNLGYRERERPIHSPAVNADMRKIAAFRRAPLVKKHGVGFEKSEYHRGIAIGGTKHGGDTGYWHVHHLNL
jgi:hypothetical protein